jgi:hypothetical protein
MDCVVPLPRRGLLEGVPLSITDIHRRYGGRAEPDLSDHEAFDALHHDGGFTRHALTGESPRSGYMVSLHPRYGGDEEVHDLGEITPEHIADHRARTRRAATEQGRREHFYQGGWVSGGKAYLDRSLNVRDRDDAELLGEQHKQRAIWDVEGNEEIPLDQPKSEEETNKKKHGCYHTACGRVLKNRHEASKVAAYQDVPTTRIDPVRHVIEGARAYSAHKGLADPHEGIDYHQVMTHRNLITSLGREYDKLPLDDPAAHPHFEAMRREVNEQYHHMTKKMGLHVEVTDHDPYKNVHELADDVRNNKRIKVLGTHVTGAHPFFSTDENDKFRAVHDVFGHLGAGRGLDRHGEEAAYQAHSRMFSEQARGALASETRGQNGSLIVNGRFGPQKIAVLPHRLWSPSLAQHGMIDLTSAG